MPDTEFLLTLPELAVQLVANKGSLDEKARAVCFAIHSRMAQLAFTMYAWHSYIQLLKTVHLCLTMHAQEAEDATGHARAPEEFAAALGLVCRIRSSDA